MLLWESHGRRDAGAGKKGTAWVAQMQIGGILGDDLQVDVGEPLSLLKWRRVCGVVSWREPWPGDVGKNDRRGSKQDGRGHPGGNAMEWTRPVPTCDL